MKSYIEEYGWITIVTIIILSLMLTAGLLNTEVKTHINSKLANSLSDSGITQLDPDKEATSGSGNGGLVIDISNAYGVLPIEKGGTGATSIEQAKTNLGLTEVADMDLVPIKNGGTGKKTANEAVKTLGAMKTNETLDAIFPVGSIFINTVNVDPATLFGGKWEKIEEKFLVGAGGKYPLNSTGGSADGVIVSHSHTFSGSTNTTGAHQHKQLMHRSTGSGTYYAKILYNKKYYHTTYTTPDGNHTHTFSGTTSTDGEPTVKDKNIPKYYAVNLWKRIS